MKGKLVIINEMPEQVSEESIIRYTLVHKNIVTCVMADKL